ncbi:hypothetical protein P879_01060 [Paragonimus westermani]|uniref:J domain-containing protein n=1 Tax=Paragonimus westermani TaxID=34504 RepID=A0A8T0DU19_9TREM|nr:hypothetical protein P879_01060 [Paragonimus westermani]
MTTDNLLDENDPLLDDAYKDDALDDTDDPPDPSFVHLLDSMEETESKDLYAVLGVSKTATPTEIRAAYKRLSLLLHPDRHTSGTSTGDNRTTTMQTITANAEAAFGRVSAAYNVLSDPEKRTIYDIYGHDGLQMQGWEVVSCEKSAPELRLEYLMLKQKALAEKQLQLTQPMSEFSVGLDLTDLFDRYYQETPEERTSLPLPTVNHLYLAQSVTAGLTLRNAVSLAGQVTAHNGLGVGTWMVMWRHYCGKHSLLSFTTIDTEVSYGRAGRGLSTGFRLRRAFGDRYVGTLGLTLSSVNGRSRFSLIPGLSTGWQVQLLPRTQARVEWRWNLDPGLSSELVWSSSDDTYLARLSLNLTSSGRAGVAVRLEKSVSWSWFSPPRGSGAAAGEENHEFSSSTQPDWAKTDDNVTDVERNRQGRVFASVDVNTTDLIEFILGAQCHISLYSRLSGSLSFSLQRGVSLKLSLQRGSQTYSLPVTLSEHPNHVAAGYGFIVPLLLFAAVRTLIYEPYLNRQMEKAQLARRTQLKTELARRRREALATQSLMRSTADRIRSSETDIGGLVIVRAVYGFLTPESSQDKSYDVGGPLTVDVTIPIQSMVEQSRLRLPPGRWSDLQGFYDPCLGIVSPPPKTEYLRQLQIVYTFHGVSHEVTVSEKQGLAIPMTKHRIESI